MKMTVDLAWMLVSFVAALVHSAAGYTYVRILSILLLNAIEILYEKTILLLIYPSFSVNILNECEMINSNGQLNKIQM